MACYKRILNEFNNKIPQKLVDLDLSEKFKFVSLDTDIVSKTIGVINNNSNSNSNNSNSNNSNSNRNIYNEFHKYEDNDTIELVFNLPSDYPFKAPTIGVRSGRLNDMNYQKWLSAIIDNRQCGHCRNYYKPDLFLAWAFSVILRPNLSSYWRGLIPTEKTCLCCETVLCASFWNPSIMMSDVLAEYITRRDFKIYTGELMQRYIQPIFTNDRWQLPDEIILEIVSKFL